MSLQKASPFEIPVRGNAAKFFTYREAWSRINAAYDQGFFLEAVAIQESIIADRLMAFLNEADGFCKVVGKRFVGFGELIRRWNECHSEPIAVKDIGDLRYAVNNWRDLRNQVMHGMVKSQDENSPLPIEDFLELAKHAATMGTKLARAVDNWRQTARTARLRSGLAFEKTGGDS